MYAVVGCGECQALWIVEGRPDSSQCPRCGKTRAYSKRKKFFRSDNEDEARQARSTLLARQQGLEDEFAALPTFDELESQVEDAGIDDRTYLEASGIDPAEVETAGTRLTESKASQSREEIVREALSELDRPEKEDIIEYATERDVEETDTVDLLEKLVRAGEVSRQRGTYRLL